MVTDPMVEEYLRTVRSSTDHVSRMTVDESRRISREQEAFYSWDPEVAVDVSDARVSVPEGFIPVKIYSPSRLGGESRLPLLFFIHGGGWVLGWVDSPDVDAICRYISGRVNCIVVSVGYRLSPDSKFPGPVEDSYAALTWAVKNAPMLRCDRKKVAVVGESAGGNLVAAVSLMARDKGGPSILFQVPIYPAMDFSSETESYRAYGTGYGLDSDDMMWFWRQYLRGDEDAKNPYASPIRADDLSGLPPAFVMTAELDVLRDEGEVYAEKLKAAGVPVKLSRAQGKPHGFLSMPFGETEREELVAELLRVFE